MLADKSKAPIDSTIVTTILLEALIILIILHCAVKPLRNQGLCCSGLLWRLSGACLFTTRKPSRKEMRQRQKMAMWESFDDVTPSTGSKGRRPYQTDPEEGVGASGTSRPEDSPPDTWTLARETAPNALNVMPTPSEMGSEPRFRNLHGKAKSSMTVHSPSRTPAKSPFPVPQRPFTPRGLGRANSERGFQGSNWMQPPLPPPVPNLADSVGDELTVFPEEDERTQYEPTLTPMLREESTVILPDTMSEVTGRSVQTRMLRRSDGGFTSILDFGKDKY